MCRNKVQHLQSLFLTIIIWKAFHCGENRKLLWPQSSSTFPPPNIASVFKEPFYSAVKKIPQESKRNSCDQNLKQKILWLRKLKRKKQLFWKFNLKSMFGMECTFFHSSLVINGDWVPRWAHKGLLNLQCSCKVNHVVLALYNVCFLKKNIYICSFSTIQAHWRKL